MTTSEYESAYRALHGAVLGKLRRALHGAADADDLAAEVWLRAWERRDQCRGQVRGWVHTIARNCLFAYWRRRHYEPLPDPDLLPGREEWPLIDARVALEQIAARMSSASRLWQPERPETSTERSRRHRALKQARAVVRGTIARGDHSSR